MYKTYLEQLNILPNSNIELGNITKIGKKIYDTIIKNQSFTIEEILQVKFSKMVYKDKIGRLFFEGNILKREYYFIYYRDFDFYTETIKLDPKEISIFLLEKYLQNKDNCIEYIVGYADEINKFKQLLL